MRLVKILQPRGGSNLIPRPLGYEARGGSSLIPRPLGYEARGGSSLIPRPLGYEARGGSSAVTDNVIFFASEQMRASVNSPQIHVISSETRCSVSQCQSVLQHRY